MKGLGKMMAAAEKWAETQKRDVPEVQPGGAVCVQGCVCAREREGHAQIAAELLQKGAAPLFPVPASPCLYYRLPNSSPGGSLVRGNLVWTKLPTRGNFDRTKHPTTSPLQAKYPTTSVYNDI